MNHMTNELIENLFMNWSGCVSAIAVARIRTSILNSEFNTNEYARARECASTRTNEFWCSWLVSQQRSSSNQYIITKIEVLFRDPQFKQFCLYNFVYKWVRRYFNLRIEKIFSIYTQIHNNSRGGMHFSDHELIPYEHCYPLDLYRCLSTVFVHTSWFYSNVYYLLKIANGLWPIL